MLRNLEIVRALGRKVQDNRLEIRLTQQDRERAARLLARIPASTAIVAVGIGAGSASRRWPLECYAKTLTRLTKERRVQAVILCSPSERKEARKLAQLLLHEPIIVSSDHLREACAVLERCHLFIGNDSGCAHLAAAMRCKTIVISRHPSNGDPNHRNSPVRFAPWCECVQVLQPARGLGPCKTACLSLEPHCITAVPVEEVVATAKEMLARDLGRIDTVMLAPYNDDSLAGSKSIAAALKEAPELPGIGRSRPEELT